jgi:hypothetical protein
VKVRPRDESTISNFVMREPAIDFIYVKEVWQCHLGPLQLGAPIGVRKSAMKMLVYIDNYVVRF